MVAVLYLVLGVSMEHCEFLLAGIHVLLKVALSSPSPVNSGTVLVFLSIPSNVRMMLDVLDLKPATTAFVCCPKCFPCYVQHDAVPYLDCCMYQDTSSSSSCNCELQKTIVLSRRHRTFPARQYIYNCMKQWMALMLCRPSIELLLDRDLFPMEENQWSCMTFGTDVSFVNF